MVRALACLMAYGWLACRFTDPDLTPTQFRCDDNGACPSGQTCKTGLCLVASHDGVACTGMPCVAGAQCCDDGSNPLHCLSGTDECLGVTAFCDGVEDCAAGLRCCVLGAVQACADEADCLLIACQEPADCPEGRAPNCCAGEGDPKPWKFCRLEPC